MTEHLQLKCHPRLDQMIFHVQPGLLVLCMKPKVHSYNQEYAIQANNATKFAFCYVFL